MKKALEIRQQSLPSNHPDLALVQYGNIGNGVFRSWVNIQKQFHPHEKALEIQQQSLPANHPDLAIVLPEYRYCVFQTWVNIQKRFHLTKKHLKFRQQSLPANHPDLAKSYNNIGLVYSNTGEYSKARSYYERAVDIGKQSLPAHHPLSSFVQEQSRWSKIQIVLCILFVCSFYSRKEK